MPWLTVVTIATCSCITKETCDVRIRCFFFSFPLYFTWKSTLINVLTESLRIILCFMILLWKCKTSLHEFDIFWSEPYEVRRSNRSYSGCICLIYIEYLLLFCFFMKVIILYCIIIIFIFSSSVELKCVFKRYEILTTEWPIHRYFVLSLPLSLSIITTYLRLTLFTLGYISVFQFSIPVHFFIYMPLPYK